MCLRLKTLFLTLCLLSSCSVQEKAKLDLTDRSPNSNLKAELGPNIEVLVWNAFKGSKARFKEDAYRLMRNKDLVLFQECVQDEDFHKVIGLRNRLEVEFATSWGKNGVCTSANVPSLEALAIKTDVRELYVFTPKSTLITLYPMRSATDNLEELMVINIHMINFRANFAFQKQLEQMREAISEHNGPIIVAGDFNTWMAARERRVEKFLAEFGLKEVEFNKQKSRRDPRALALGVLDRAYIRGLEVVQTEVYQEVTSSDHKPFSFQLTLP